MLREPRGYPPPQGSMIKKRDSLPFSFGSVLSFFILAFPEIDDARVSCIVAPYVINDNRGSIGLVGVVAVSSRGDASGEIRELSWKESKVDGLPKNPQDPLKEIFFPLFIFLQEKKYSDF